MGLLSNSQTPATGMPFTNSITHPSHPGCTFSLLSSDTSGQIYCDACTGTVVGLYYHCNNHGYGHGRYDLHLGCYDMPPKKNHPAHTCELFLTFTTPYPPHGFSCSICREPGWNNQWLYRCNIHGFDAHLHCVGAATMNTNKPNPEYMVHPHMGAPAMNPYSNYYNNRPEHMGAPAMNNPYPNYNYPQHMIQPATTTPQSYPHQQRPPFPHAPTHTNPQVLNQFGSGQVHSHAPRPRLSAPSTVRATGRWGSSLMPTIVGGAVARGLSGSALKLVFDNNTHHDQSSSTPSPSMDQAGSSIPSQSMDDQGSSIPNNQFTDDGSGGGDVLGGHDDIIGELHEGTSEGGSILEGLFGIFS